MAENGPKMVVVQRKKDPRDSGGDTSSQDDKTSWEDDQATPALDDMDPGEYSNQITFLVLLYGNRKLYTVLYSLCILLLRKVTGNLLPGFITVTYG